MSAVLDHAARDLAAHLRAEDQVERIEQVKANYEAFVHADLRAQVLAALALGNSKAPLPNYAVQGTGSRAKSVERFVRPFEAIEEALPSERFQQFLLDMLAENTLAAQQARHAIATYYADLNAAGVAEARNWGLK